MLIIVRSLDNFNFYFLKLFIFFGFKVIFFETKIENKKDFIKYIKKKKIIHYSSIKICKLNPYKEYTLSSSKTLNKIIKNLKKEIKLLSRITNFSNHEIKTIIFFYLRPSLKFIDYLLIKKKLSKNFHLDFFVMNFKEKMILDLNTSNSSSKLTYIIQNLKIFLIYFFRYIKLKIKNETINKNFQNKQNDINNYQTVFFPHQTINYGNIYEKDDYYSKNKYSLFNKKNILHLEIEKNDYSKNFYSKKNFNYEFINLDKIKFFEIIKKIGFLNIFQIPYSIFHIILIKNFISYNNYFNKKNFKSLKYVIIGNQYLFDPLILFVLKKKNVKIISKQDRYVNCKYKTNTGYFDYFFVYDKFSEENFKKNPYFKAKNYVKSYNTELKNKIRKSIKNKLIYKDPVVIFDNTVDFIKDQSNNVTFENQIRFYENILVLCKKYPNQNFIIKSKSYGWMRIFYFNKILKKIKKLNNLKILNKNTPSYLSYSLIKRSKVILTKPSSVIDEALALNKKILVHDFEKNIPSILKNYINFSIDEIFCQSEEEFFSKFDIILNNKQKIKKKEKYYFFKFNYRTKSDRIRKFLNTLEIKNK